VRCAIVSFVVLTILVASCGTTEERSVAAFCDAIDRGSERLAENAERAQTEDNPLAGLLVAVGGYGEFNQMLEEAADVAPTGIQTEAEIVRDVFKEQTDFESSGGGVVGAVSDLLSSVLLTSSVRPQFERFDQFTTDNCGVSVFGITTLLPDDSSPDPVTAAETTESPDSPTTTTQPLSPHEELLNADGVILTTCHRDRSQLAVWNPDTDQYWAIIELPDTANGCDEYPFMRVEPTYRSRFSSDFEYLAYPIRGDPNLRGDPDDVGVLSLASGRATNVSEPRRSADAFSAPATEVVRGWSSDDLLYLSSWDSLQDAFPVDTQGSVVGNVVPSAILFDSPSFFVRSWGLRRLGTNIWPNHAMVNPQNTAALVDDSGVIMVAPGEVLVERIESAELVTNSISARDRYNAVGFGTLADIAGWRVAGAVGWVAENQVIDSGWDLWTLDLEGLTQPTAPTQLLPNFTGRSVDYPLVTPDGRVLLRSTTETGQTDLFEVDPTAPGSQPTLVRSLAGTTLPEHVGTILGWVGSYCPTAPICEAGSAHPWKSLSDGAASVTTQEDDALNGSSTAYDTARRLVEEDPDFQPKSPSNDPLSFSCGDPVELIGGEYEVVESWQFISEDNSAKGGITGYRLVSQQDTERYFEDYETYLRSCDRHGIVELDHNIKQISPRLIEHTTHFVGNDLLITFATIREEQFIVFVSGPESWVNSIVEQLPAEP